MGSSAIRPRVRSHVEGRSRAQAVPGFSPREQCRCPPTSASLLPCTLGTKAAHRRKWRTNPTSWRHRLIWIATKIVTAPVRPSTPWWSRLRLKKRETNGSWPRHRLLTARPIQAIRQHRRARMTRRVRAACRHSPCSWASEATRAACSCLATRPRCFCVATRLSPTGSAPLVDEQ